MGTCERINCGYWWQDEWDVRPRCHYDDPWPAPCEYEDEPEEDSYEEE